MKATAEQYVAEELLPRLREQFTEVLGRGLAWSLRIDPSDAQLVQFAYPRLSNGDESLQALSVKPVVRLEFGARSDHWPAKNYQI